MNEFLKRVSELSWTEIKMKPVYRIWWKDYILDKEDYDYDITEIKEDKIDIKIPDGYKIEWSWIDIYWDEPELYFYKREVIKRKPTEEEKQKQVEEIAENIKSMKETIEWFEKWQKERLDNIKSFWNEK
jgi:hypothetical protein